MRRFLVLIGAKSVVKQKRVILGVTGSIAAYKSAEIIRRLIEKGLKVSVIMTKEAEHFITPLTLASLSGERIRDNKADLIVQMDI